MLLNKSDGQNSPAHRDGKIKDREHICPLPLDVEVSDDGGGDGGVAGLSDSDQAASQQQGPEMLQGRRVHVQSRSNFLTQVLNWQRDAKTNTGLTSLGV